MIINDPDAFRNWLIAILEPLCDADPGALAKYVYALCKKDRPENELRESMLDQLDVFLQSGTKAFVAKLMKTLETQVYELPSPESTVKDDEESQEESPGVGTPVVDQKTLEAATPPREASPASPTPTNQDKVLSNTPKLDSKIVNKNGTPHFKDIHQAITPLNKKEKEKSKDKDSAVSNSDLYNGSSARRERDSRKSEPERDDRRRHRSRTRSRSRSWERSRRSRSRDRRERDKSRQWRNKSPPSIGATGHAPPLRRYRPSPPLPRGGRLSGNRSSNRYRNRSPSPPPRSRYSKSRDDRTRSRTRTRSRSRSRTGDRDFLSGPATPTQDSNHGEPDMRLGNTAQSIQSVVPNLKSGSQRCRDYDEKGYCMKGDLCPYDHGVDPVILQDVNLPGVLAGFGPSSTSDDSVAVPGTVPPMPAQGSRLTVGRMPSHSEYNPDAPAMWLSGQQRGVAGAPTAPFIRQAGPRYPNVGPPGHPAHMYGPAPPFPYGGSPRGSVHNHPARELIAVPVVDDATRTGGEGGGNNKGPKRAIEAEAFESMPKRKGQFDFNRLGPIRGAMRPSSALELKKVPRGLNSIEHLNNHFAKFGKIVNIQISYEGDPEGAIVTFATHAEANAAYRSTEAVLNNRFIKVFWHNPESKSDQNSPMQNFHSAIGTTHNRQIIKDHTGGGAVGQPNSPFAAATTVKDAATAAGGGASCPPTTHPTANRGEAGGAPPADAKAQAISAIQKNQAALAAQHALRKKKEESRKEAFAIAEGLSKRKQEILQGQLKQQRLLIQRLEKAESQSQKDTLISTIKTVQESIERLQAEIKSTRETVLAQMANATSAGGTQNSKLTSKPGRLTREQAQKEILDAELEIFTKQQSGADITALQKKVVDLRAQVPFLRSTFWRGGRGAYRGGAKLGTGRPPYNATSVDRRPTKLLVTGFDKDEADHVVEHFKKFGEIADHIVEPTTPALSVRYVIRAHAEQAMLKGRQFYNKTLSMTWISENNKPEKEKSADVVVKPLKKLMDSNSSSNSNSNSTTNSIHKSESELNVDMSDTLDLDDNILNDLSSNDLDLQGDSDSEMKYIAFEESLLQEEEEDDENDENEARSWRR